MLSAYIFHTRSTINIRHMQMKKIVLHLQLSRWWIKGPLNAGRSSKILVPSLAQPLLSFSWRNELYLERRSSQGSFPGSLVSGLKVRVKKPLSSHRRNSSFEHFWWSVWKPFLLQKSVSYLITVCALPAEVLRKFYSAVWGWRREVLFNFKQHVRSNCDAEETCVRSLKHQFGQEVKGKQSLVRRNIEQQGIREIAYCDGTQGHHFGWR